MYFLIVNFCGEYDLWIRDTYTSRHIIIIVFFMLSSAEKKNPEKDENKRIYLILVVYLYIEY